MAKKSSSFRAKGQGSIEFMLAVSALLIFFVLVVVIYAQESAELGLIQRRLSSLNICNAVALQIDALASGESGANATIAIAPMAAGENYNLTVFPGLRYIRVDIVNSTAAAGQEGSGCTYRAMNVANATGGTSISLVNPSVRMNYSNGVVSIG